MKKIVALLFVFLFMFSMVATAFAGPACDECGGNMIIKYGSWEKKQNVTISFAEYWEERTVTVKCTNN